MPTPTLRTTLSSMILAAGLLALAAPANLASAGPLSWLSGERVQGNGKLVKQQRDLAHFTGLTLSMAGDVEVRLGNTESVLVETDENLLPLIETVVENGTLRIRPAKNVSFVSRSLKIIVTARSLERVAVAGSGSISADALRGERLQLEVGGSGDLTVRKIEAESLAVALGGSGSLDVGGKVERLQISLGGSGQVEAGKLAAREATVSIGGSGAATVWASKRLNLSLAGSGSLSYYGDPQISKSVSGSGGVQRLGGAPN